MHHARNDPPEDTEDQTARVVCAQSGRYELSEPGRNEQHLLSSRALPHTVAEDQEVQAPRTRDRLRIGCQGYVRICTVQGIVCVLSKPENQVYRGNDDTMMAKQFYVAITRACAACVCSLSSYALHPCVYVKSAASPPLYQPAHPKPDTQANAYVDLSVTSDRVLNASRYASSSALTRVRSATSASSSLRSSPKRSGL